MAQQTGWKRRWKRARFVRFLDRSHYCVDCGFLAWAKDGSEATAIVRRTVAAGGSAGWYTPEGCVDCSKSLWFWEDDSDFGIVIAETSKARKCSGFLRYVPGRSPADHLKLEDEQRAFRRQILLASLGATLAIVGGIVGYLIRGG